MKLLSLVLLTLSMVSFGQNVEGVASKRIKSSPVIRGLLSGIQTEYRVKCEEITNRTNNLFFYADTAGLKYNLKTNCFSGSDISVKIEIIGTSGEGYQLIETVSVLFAD